MFYIYGGAHRQVAGERKSTWFGVIWASVAGNQRLWPVIHPAVILAQRRLHAFVLAFLSARLRPIFSKTATCPPGLRCRAPLRTCRRPCTGGWGTAPSSWCRRRSPTSSL